MLYAILSNKVNIEEETMEEIMNKPIPLEGKNCFYDMISNENSFEAKANASRRYAEMIISLFLTSEIKLEKNSDKFNAKSLGNKIRSLQKYYDNKIIQSLYFIKSIGDKGSHYNVNNKLTEKEIIKVVEVSLGLFELILIDYFKKTRLDKTYNTARIFSTLFPNVRVNILSKLINLKQIKNRYDEEVLHKYLLALVKSGRKNKAYRVLDEAKKNGINDNLYIQEKDSIRIILEGMNKNELPIPQKIEDCKRNYNEVLKTLDCHEMEDNNRLITIMDTLLKQIEPSKMGDKIPDQLYILKYTTEFLF